MRLIWVYAGLCCAASMAAAQAGNQTGIAHVAFRVADLDASRAFYNKLGFEQFYEVKQGERVTQAFLKVNDRQFIELYPRTDAAQPLGLMHVCYEAGDLEALRADYGKRGITASEVRKAGAGNLLMTMKDAEGQTIEYTQYLPGSRHYDDRGKHLGANRLSQTLEGATAPAKDAAATRAFYVEQLGFTEAAGSVPMRLRMPGNSGQTLEIAAADAKPGMRLVVADLQQTAAALAKLGLNVKINPGEVAALDPDGAVVWFVKASR